MLCISRIAKGGLDGKKRSFVAGGVAAQLQSSDGHGSVPRQFGEGEWYNESEAVVKVENSIATNKAKGPHGSVVAKMLDYFVSSKSNETHVRRVKIEQSNRSNEVQS